MSKKNIFFTLVLIFSIALIATSLKISWAQTKQVTATDPKAKVILDGLSKKYKALTAIKAAFKITMEAANGKNKDEKKGSLVLKGLKYQIVLENQEITCDNKTVWTYLKEANEVKIDNYEPDAHAINPSDIFTMYEKGFLYQLAEVVKENGKDLQVIELTPMDKKREFFKIKLFVDKAAQAIVKTRIFNNNGTHINYEIIQFTPNPAITDAYFTFDAKKHPGVEVNDIR